MDSAEVALMPGFIVLPALQAAGKGLGRIPKDFFYDKNVPSKTWTKMCRQKHVQALVINNYFDVFGFETRAFAKQKGLACAHIARKALVILSLLTDREKRARTGNF